MNKHQIIVGLFYSLIIFVGIAAIHRIYRPLTVKMAKLDEEVIAKRSLSFLHGVDYFVYDSGEQQFYLNATELFFGPSSGEDTSQIVKFLTPNGYLFGNDREKIFYSGLKGQYLQSEGRLQLQEQAMIKKRQDSLAAEQVTYQRNEGRLLASGQVKTETFLASTRDIVRIFAEKLESWPQKNTGTYFGNVHGVIDRQKKYETDVLFATQQLFLDGNTAWAKLLGDVEIKQNNLVVQAKRGELFLENYNKKLKYYVLYDDVKVREKLVLANHQVVERKAFSEQLEGVVAEDKLILKGFPRVIQGEDTVKGNLIVLRQSNEILEVDDAHTNWMIKNE